MKKLLLLCLTCIMVMSCDVITIRNSLDMMVHGEKFWKIPTKKGEAFVVSQWEGGNIHYRIKIGFNLNGKKFSIQPVGLNLIPSSNWITVVPDSNNYALTPESYQKSNSIFSSEISATQQFDITYNALIDNDTVSFKIPPSDYLLYDGEPLLTDTITIIFKEKNYPK